MENLPSRFMPEQLLERRIGSLPNISPSAQVLFAKFALVTLAALVAVGSVGIDLSVLAVFGGALGVGVGFGVQKIVASSVEFEIPFPQRDLHLRSVAPDIQWPQPMAAD